MIKKKDGTVYRLNSPNPLVSDQEFWAEKDEFIIHNFDWDKTLTELGDFLPSFQLQKPEVIDPEAIDPEVESEVEPEVIDPKSFPLQKPEVIDPEVKEPEVKEEKPLYLKNVVVIHCQPVIIKEHKDDLYDESYKKNQYGEKFTFEGIIIQREDFMILFWTNIELTKNSILYPSKYRDGVKFGDYRWWKVNDMREKSGGFVVQAVVSDYQPDFT